VQAYVHCPSNAAEPPEQLRAFTHVGLAPHASRTVTLTMNSSAFQSLQGRGFTTVAGVYRIDVGQSSATLPIHLSLTRP
jgi:hypothetical protein